MMSESNGLSHESAAGNAGHRDADVTCEKQTCTNSGQFAHPRPLIRISCPRLATRLIEEWLTAAGVIQKTSFGE